VEPETPDQNLGNFWKEREEPGRARPDGGRNEEVGRPNDVDGPLTEIA